MKFPNAYSGVKKIFSAEILEIIGIACLFIAALFSLTTVGAVAGGSKNGALASLGGAALFGLAGGVLAIIAFIFTIIGINSASKDEPVFKPAMAIIFVGIIASIVSSVSSLASSSGILHDLASDFSSVASILVTYYIIQGIISLANKLSNSEMADKGKSICTLVMTVFALYLIAQVLSQFVVAGTVSAIVAIVAAVLEIVQYVIYLTYLAKAKAMLAE